MDEDNNDEHLNRKTSYEHYEQEINFDEQYKFSRTLWKPLADHEHFKLL